MIEVDAPRQERQTKCSLSIAAMTRRQCLFSVAAIGFTACSRSDNAGLAGPAGPEQAYLMAEKASGFDFGLTSAAVAIHVFFDTQCDYCADLWKSSQPLKNRLRMKWIPVGLLKPTSLPQAAAILADRDPVQAMNRYHGSMQSPPPTAQQKLKVDKNTLLLGTLHSRGVPFLIYKHATTGHIGYASGALGTEQLAALVGR